MSLQRRFACALKTLGIRDDVPAAIALSGGPDSLALAILASGWLHREHSVHPESHRDSAWTAMVVDHGLRAEATAEAVTAVRQAELLGFQAVLLQAAWPDGVPEKGHLMEMARQTRYGLLEAKCMELDIPHLLTAHHADDQAESGLIRLLRASGIQGLQGMLPSRPFFSAALGTSPGRIVRPLLGIHKHELVALCQTQRLPFAVDPTNNDTFFARNHLRKLMGVQDAAAECAPWALAGCSPSQAGVTENAGVHLAARAGMADVSVGQGLRYDASRKIGTGGQSPSRALTADVLRVMAACSAASQKLQEDADLALEQACLPGPPTLLDVARLLDNSKHVAIRALARALMGTTQPDMDGQAMGAISHKAAVKLWTALQPGRQPRAFSRGGSIECHVRSAPHPSMVHASIVMWPAAGSAAQHYEPRRQALLLKVSPDAASSTFRHSQSALV